MALHIIRDKEGRMEKILDDKEYDRHRTRKGCFQFLFFVAIVALYIYGRATQEPDGSLEVKTEVSAVEPEETAGLKEVETASSVEDTFSVIDEDELVQRFLKNQ